MNLRTIHTMGYVLGLLGVVPLFPATSHAQRLVPVGVVVRDPTPAVVGYRWRDNDAHLPAQPRRRRSEETFIATAFTAAGAIGGAVYFSNKCKRENRCAQPANLLVGVMVGSLAGAIVGAIVATALPDEREPESEPQGTQGVASLRRSPAVAPGWP